MSECVFRGSEHSRTFLVLFYSFTIFSGRISLLDSALINLFIKNQLRLV